MEIVSVATTVSTNADVLALATRGAAEGLWLRAGVQTAGRGRQGRTWVSPPGNLYVTTLVRLRAADPPAATLALVAAIALQEAVALFGVSPHIKWPNDLLVAGAKLSGILLERQGDAIAIGFGVNVAHHPTLPDRPATSLARHGAAVEPHILAETLAEVFARWLERWRGEGVAPVRRRWQDLAHPPGTALSVRTADGGAIDGLYVALDDDGALILRLADGTARVIHAGDVFLI
ncbi:biotin--[acetyl-CoA-carboxylase] ligase [Sphingomonas sp. RS2018]